MLIYSHLSLAVAYTFYTYLINQSDTDVFKTSVTLAAGDVKWSKDGSSS